MLVFTKDNLASDQLTQQTQHLFLGCLTKYTNIPHPCESWLCLHVGFLWDEWVWVVCMH